MSDVLSKMEEDFLEALFDPAIKGNRQKAAAKIGLSKAPPIRGKLRDAILARANDLIAENAPKAVFATEEVLEGDPTNPKMMVAGQVMKAATEILDRCGLVKIERVKVEGLENSIVFLPDKKPIKDE